MKQNTFSRNTSIIDQFIKNDIISSDDKELYSYGLHQGMILLLNIITTILIGLAFGMAWQSFVFMIAYIPLRSYAGGYHAKTQIGCYFISVLLIITALLGIRYIPWTITICLIVVLSAGGIIFFASPVENINKPLCSTEEKIAYKKKMRIILFILLGMIFLFWFINRNISICLAMVLIILSIMIIFGVGRLKFVEIHKSLQNIN